MTWEDLELEGYLHIRIILNYSVQCKKKAVAKNATACK